MNKNCINMLVIIFFCIFRLSAQDIRSDKSVSFQVRGKLETFKNIDEINLTLIKSIDNQRVIKLLAKRDNKWIIFCAEGESTLVPCREKSYLPLSFISINDDTLKIEKYDPVLNINFEKSSPILLEVDDYVKIVSDHALYLWNGLIEQSVNDKLIIQNNSLGSTVQPGYTVKKSVFKNSSYVVYINNKIIIKDTVTQTNIFSMSIPSHMAKLKIVSYQYPFVIFANESSSINKTVDTSPISTGCIYSLIMAFNIETKEKCLIEPFISSDSVRYSKFIVANNEFLWWEYYPSEKLPNGIWLLRLKKQNSEPQIVTAMRNINNDFYIWNSKKWTKLDGSFDSKLPQVGLANDGRHVCFSMFGHIYLINDKIEVSVK